MSSRIARGTQKNLVLKKKEEEEKEEMMMIKEIIIKQCENNYKSVRNFF